VVLIISLEMITKISYIATKSNLRYKYYANNNSTGVASRALLMIGILVGSFYYGAMFLEWYFKS